MWLQTPAQSFRIGSSKTNSPHAAFGLSKRSNEGLLGWLAIKMTGLCCLGTWLDCMNCCIAWSPPSRLAVTALVSSLFECLRTFIARNRFAARRCARFNANTARWGLYHRIIPTTIFEIFLDSYSISQGVASAPVHVDCVLIVANISSLEYWWLCDAGCRGYLWAPNKRGNKEEEGENPVKVGDWPRSVRFVKFC